MDPMEDKNPDIAVDCESKNIEEEGSSFLPDHLFDIQKSRNMVGTMICTTGLPFEVVESKRFQRFSFLLQPNFIMPSSEAVVEECFRLYNKEKKELKRMLVKKEQRVCLTTDKWRTVENSNYMVLSAHFIDDDWNLHRRVLNFFRIPARDDDEEAVTEMIEYCLTKWGIEKVFTFTVDDVISNNGVLAYFAEKIRNGNGVVLNGEFMHVRSCTHIVNLIVCDALKGFEDSIKKISIAIQFVRMSSSLLETFRNYVTDEKILRENHICLDEPNRWDSTYIMLNNAEKFQKVFERLEVEDEEFCFEFTEYGCNPPGREDWDNARALVKFLKIFRDANLRISRWSSVTSHRFFHEICLIHKQIYKYSTSNNPLFNDIVRNMKEKYEKYWGDIEKMNDLLYVAIVLDPRYKLQFVLFTLSLLYGEERSNEIGKKVEDTMRRLFNEYRTSNMDGETALTSTDQMLVEGEEEEDDFASLFAKHLIQQAMKENKTELDKYLSEPCEIADDEFEILDWWEMNSSKYKILGKIAKDVLAIPLSTVTAESAFFTEVRELDSCHSSLTPKLVEAVFCLQNWLRSPQEIDTYEPLNELEMLEDGNGFHILNYNYM